MKMRKMGTADGKDMYKGESGWYTKNDKGKASKDKDFDESKLSKAEKPGDEEDMDEEDEDEAAKSLTAEDLRKSVDALTGFAATTGDRKEELLQKAQTTTLEKSEADELYLLTTGQAPEGEADPLSKAVADTLGTGTETEKAMDISPFLVEQNTELRKSLGTLADAVEGGNQRTYEFNLILAKAVADIGNTVLAKSEEQATSLTAIQERLGIIEHQPVRAPKSQGLTGAEPMNKSFGGGAGSGEGEGPYDGLHKAQVLDGLEDMLHKGINDAGGESLVTVIAGMEQGSPITRPVLNAVKDHLKSNAA